MAEKTQKKVSISRKLTANDRKQLCKITEGRFEILNQELYSRKDQIEKEIEKQVLAEHDADIKSVRKELEKWHNENEKLAKKHEEEVKASNAKKSRIIEAAESNGLKIQKPGFGKEIEEISPQNLRKAIKSRMEGILDQYSDARKSLKTLELETLEKISVAGLETEEAKDFLTEIPDLDNLLPPPADIPELAAGAK